MEQYKSELNDLSREHKSILAKIPPEDIARKPITVHEKVSGVALGDQQQEQELISNSREIASIKVLCYQSARTMLRADQSPLERV